MKVAIATSGNNLDSQVSPVFGRAPWFLLVESETEEFEAVENKFAQTARGAGVAASQEIVNRQVQAVIGGNFGPNAYHVLSGAGIKIYNLTGAMTAKQALSLLKEGKLPEISGPTESFGPGFGGGFGRGFGRK